MTAIYSLHTHMMDLFGVQFRLLLEVMVNHFFSELETDEALNSTKFDKCTSLRDTHCFQIDICDHEISAISYNTNIMNMPWDNFNFILFKHCNQTRKVFKSFGQKYNVKIISFIP